MTAQHNPAGWILGSTVEPEFDLGPDPATAPFAYLFEILINDPDAYLPVDDPAAATMALTALERALVETQSTSTPPAPRWSPAWVGSSTMA